MPGDKRTRGRGGNAVRSLLIHNGIFLQSGSRLRTAHFSRFQAPRGTPPSSAGLGLPGGVRDGYGNGIPLLLWLCMPLSVDDR